MTIQERWLHLIDVTVKEGPLISIVGFFAGLGFRYFYIAIPWMWIIAGIVLSLTLWLVGSYVRNHYTPRSMLIQFIGPLGSLLFFLLAGFFIARLFPI